MGEATQIPLRALGIGDHMDVLRQTVAMPDPHDRQPIARAVGQVFLGVAAVEVLATLALGIAGRSWWIMAVWTVAMVPPLLVLPGLAAWAAARRGAGAQAAAQHAAIEAEHGPLVGREGTLKRYVPGDGFPLPHGTERWQLVDGDLVLDVAPGPVPGPSGTRVRIVDVHALRAGELPYVGEGLAVRVAAVESD